MAKTVDGGHAVEVKSYEAPRACKHQYNDVVWKDPERGEILKKKCEHCHVEGPEQALRDALVRPILPSVA